MGLNKTPEPGAPVAKEHFGKVKDRTLSFEGRGTRLYVLARREISGAGGAVDERFLHCTSRAVRPFDELRADERTRRKSVGLPATAGKLRSK
jgi:hypothetical protein